jgi:hypothetical protein
MSSLTMFSSASVTRAPRTHLAAYPLGGNSRGPMFLRRPTRVLLAVGVALELLLALFPPMRFTLALEQGQIVGRTNHFFLFRHLGGAWTIDTGRFVVYAFLVAVVTFAFVALESWFHASSAHKT